MIYTSQFFREHLEQIIMPFWLTKAVDRENGGVFTCFSNDGTTMLSRDKFVWSQGRWLWLLARSLNMAKAGKLTADIEDLYILTKQTYQFLHKHAFLDNGNAVYLLTETGSKKYFADFQDHDISFFADCFLVLGFGEWARASQSQDLFSEALALYQRICHRLESGDVRSEPYPIPTGCTPHARPMIMLNVAQELVGVAAALKRPEATQLDQQATQYMQTIMMKFRQPDGRLVEIIGECDASVLEQHCTPGHAIESMWFVMAQAHKNQDTETINQAVETIKVMFDMGWDEAHGGLLRFVDHQGDSPRGTPTSAFEEAILASWDTKLWWVHSETVYAALLAYHLTGDTTLLTLFERICDYTFQTFPNPDTAVGEWIQICNRQGTPHSEFVALPVKDPYHIYRNLLLCLDIPNLQP
ncbi:MAG: AGE family epimerase/isomerase [Deinococcota bacterium]